MKQIPALDYISLGSRIKQVRQECNITQAELAEICSLSVSYIGHIERGSRTLSVETLFKIATALDVSLDYLVSDSVPNDLILLTNIEAVLKHHDKRQVTSFLKIAKILADNIDKL